MAVDLQYPPTPETVEELGLDFGLLADLTLKTLYFAGNVSASEIADRLALAPGLTLEVLRFLRREQLCEITGGDGQFDTSLRHSLTEAGFARAAAALAQSGYVGPAPVPLDQYIASVRRQSVHDVEISRQQVVESLSRLVLHPETLNLLGQAFTSKRPLLLYGTSRNGKTTAAESLRRALSGQILIPYAVEVMHQVIQVYDPSTHETVPAHGSAQPGSHQADRRWILIQRPAVFTAGELAASHLELILDAASKTYEAPIQMKASGGLLVIDDFGRQRLDAAYLLNRWIVPLEQGVDNLSLHNGVRFQVPFDVIPMFLTNRPPTELADEAFLRRIRYKIQMLPPDADMFTEILKRECRRNEVSYDEGAAQLLVSEYFEKPGRPMRGCHPRDIVEAIADAARYQGSERALTATTIHKACAAYFI